LKRRKGVKGAESSAGDGKHFDLKNEEGKFKGRITRRKN